MYGLGSADHAFPPDSVEELVVQLGSRQAFARRRLYGGGGDNFLRRIPDTVQRVSVVLRPAGAEGGSSQSPLAQAETAAERLSEAAIGETHPKRSEYVGWALFGLSKAFIGRAQRMQIAGLETVDVFCHMSREDTEGQLRRRFETLCAKICDGGVKGDGENQLSYRRWTHAEAKARTEVLEFIRLEDYQDEDE